MAAVVARMKRLSPFLLVGFAAAAQAGVTYQFDSVSKGAGEQRMTGTVKAEGSKVRVDIVRGDKMFFKDGSTIFSADGGKTLTVADTKARSYYTLNLADVLGGANAMLQQFKGLFDIDVRNPRVAVRDRGAAGQLEDLPVRKSTVDSSYELDMKAMGKNRSIRMQMTTDVWWTNRVPAEFTNFLQLRGVRTGIRAVDKLLESQTTAIKGFPLKQVTTTRVFMGGDPMVTTTTSTVKGLRQTPIAASDFTVPTGLRKVDSPVERMMKAR
jgi:hypothetical protein